MMKHGRMEQLIPKVFGLIENQLERNDKINVSLISPLAFTNLEDILIRANNNNGNANDFVEVQIETASQEIRRLLIIFAKNGY